MIFFVFIIGLVFGSFANVLIYRMPQEKSVVSPRSFCPDCGRTIFWYDNIPVLSFILLNGRCRFCAAKIARQYPLVELFTGFIFALIFHFFGFTWMTLILLIISFHTVVISLIDFSHGIIPDELNLSLFVSGILIPGLFFRSSFLKMLAYSAVSALAAGFILFLIAVIFSRIFKQEAMGMGDVKLIAALAAFTGLPSIFWLIFLSSVFGSVVGIVIKIIKREKGFTKIAFGPYLCLAAVFYILFSEYLPALLLFT